MHGWRTGRDISCDRLYLLLRDLAKGSIRVIDQTVDVFVALAYEVLGVSGAQPLTSGERCLMNVSTDALVRSSLRAVLSADQDIRGPFGHRRDHAVAGSDSEAQHVQQFVAVSEARTEHGARPVTSSLRAPLPA